MFPQEKNDNSQQVHVVFVMEGTAAMGQFYKQLRNGYIIPTLQYFNGGPLIESSYSGQYGNKVFSLVVYNSIDYMPSQTVFCHCPTSNAWEVLKSMDEIRFVGGGGESKSLLGEGLASTMQIFDDIEAITENGPTPMVQHCIVITSSPPFMTPSFHGSRYSGYTVEDLAALISERNVNLSVISPRKLYELQQLYDKACGELQVLSTKEYAIDPRHLILLRGYELQERPQTAIEPSSVKQDHQPPRKLPTVSAPHSSTVTHSSAAPNVVVSSSSMIFKNANPSTNISNLKIAQSILQSQQQQQQQQSVPPPIPGATVVTNMNVKAPLSAGTIQLDDKHGPMSSMAGQAPPNQTVSQQQGSMTQQQPGGMTQQQQQGGIRQQQLVQGIQQQLNTGGLQPTAGIQPGMQPQTRMQIQTGMQGITRIQAQPGMQGVQQQQQQQQQGLTQQQSRLLQQQIANMQSKQPGMPQQQQQSVQQQGRVQPQPAAMGQGQAGLHGQQPGMTAQQVQAFQPGMSQQAVQISQQQQQQPNISQQQQMTSRPGQQPIAPGPAINTLQKKPGLTTDQLMKLLQNLPKEKRDIFIAEMKKKRTEGNTQAGGGVASSVAVGMQQSLNTISTMNQMTPSQKIGMGAATSQSIMNAASTVQQIPPAAISAARDVLKKARQTTTNPRMATPGGQSFNPGQPQLSNPLLNTHQLQQNLQQQQQTLQQQQQTLQQQQQQQTIQQQQQQQTGILNQGQQMLHQTPMSSGSNVAYQQQQGAITSFVNQPGNTVANQAGRPVKVLWTGMLEWHERPRQGTTLEIQQRITHCINCQVSADTETNINGTAWPKKLTMQIIPNKFLHSMGALVKNSHIVNFDFPDQGADTEARNVLLRVLQNQFAGCIHLSSEVQSNTRVLLLWYARTSNQFKGRIPKDQAGFINSFREIIKKHQQDQKQLQQQAMAGPRPQMHGAGQSMVQRPGNMSQVVGQRALAPQTVVSSNNPVITQQQKNIQDIMQKLKEGHTLNPAQQQQLQQQLQQQQQQLQQQQGQPNQQMMQQTQQMQQVNIRPNQVIGQQPGIPTQTQQLPSNAQLKNLLLSQAQTQPGQMQWNPNQQQLGQQQQQNLLLQQQQQQQQMQQAMGQQRMPQRAIMQQQQPGMMGQGSSMGQRAMLQPGMNPGAMQGMGGKPMSRQQQQQQQAQKGGLREDVSLMDLLQP